MINLTKSTRYALFAAMEMTQAGADSQVTAAQVAERFRIPATVVAKVFQQLVRAGIAIGIRGTGGGYRLARKPSRLTVLDVIEAFETGGGGERRDEDSRDDRAEVRLRRLLDEVDELTRSTFASITLETLVGRRRPGAELPVAGQGR